MRLSNFVGKTPLLLLITIKTNNMGKAEFMNPGGSVKDRMATFILSAEKKD